MKRVLALILSAVFVLGCMPLSVFADTAAVSSETAAQALKTVEWSDPIETGISGGYPRMTTVGSGVLLMAYEAGKTIKISRSDTNGKTWPTTKVAFDSTDTQFNTGVGNPTPYFDHESGKLYLSFRAPVENADGTYTANICYITSTDHGNTWSDPYIVASSTVSAEATYGGMWEATIYRVDGKLRIYYSSDVSKESDNQVAINVGTDSQSYDTTYPFVDSKAYQNIVYHTLDEATGVWSGAACALDGESLFPYSHKYFGYSSRPGMQSISQLNDGTYVMTVETSKHHFGDKYGDERYPFVIDISFSRDGVSWTKPLTIAKAPKEGYYCAAPWVDTLPDGRIVVSFQTDEHKDTVIADGESSFKRHQLKVLVSKNAVSYDNNTAISAADFDSYTPLDSLNSDVTYNAWNSVYVDGYRVYTVSRVSSLDTELSPAKGICLTAFDSAQDEINQRYKPIYTANDMIRLMHQKEGFAWQGRYKLMADIDLTEATLPYTQSPIGVSNKSARYFSGAFDGNGHVIKNVNIAGSSEYVGLFGYVLNATVTDLSVEGSITSTYASATQRALNGVGIIGHVNGASRISNIKNYATISGTATAGGIVGYAFRNGTSTGDTEGKVIIENCINYGAVSSTAASGAKGAAGGIVGCAMANTFDIEINDCINAFAVTGKRYIGGILGGGQHETAGKCYVVLNRCINDAPVTGNETDIGGMAGIGYYTKINCCLNRAAIQNNATGANVGGIAGRAHTNTYISGCVNDAEVFSKGGAILGNLGSTTSTVTNCYYRDVFATSVTTFGTKLTTRDATDPDAYTGLDFDSVFTLEQGKVALAGHADYVYYDDTYTKLSTAEDILTLMNTAGPFTGNYVLTEDIDLSTYSGELTQTMIGADAATAFKGVFEGNHHKITGIDITNNTTTKTAFFGYLSDATVRNLELEGKISSTKNYAAMMAGVVNGSTSIENCVVRGEVTGNESTGGFVGYALLNGGSLPRLSITGCTSYVHVKATSTKIGGIIGYIKHEKLGANSTISGCINRATVESSNGADSYVGGIVGCIRNNLNTVFGDGVSITGCTNYGNVIGCRRIAGIIPAVLDDKESECNVCYCTNYGYIYALGTSESDRTNVAGIVAVAINLDVEGCVNYGKIEAGKGTVIAGIIGRIFNFTSYAPAEAKNNYDLSGNGYEVVGDPDAHAASYPITNCVAVTENVGSKDIYTGLTTALYSFGRRGAYLRYTHDECASVYEVTTDPTYTETGVGTYLCPDCSKIHSTEVIGVLELVFGDLDCDCAFTNSDISLMVRILSGWNVEYVEANIDPSGDGKTNNRDAILLARKLAGWE